MLPAASVSHSHWCFNENPDPDTDPTPDPDADPTPDEGFLFTFFNISSFSLYLF
jgi:hypothetical protein